MVRTALVTVLVLLSALAANAQNEQMPPPPQSPRQALLEMFFGATPNHLEKHLPEAARKAFQQLDTGTGAGFLGEIPMIASQPVQQVPTSRHSIPAPSCFWRKIPEYSRRSRF
jgi:hypothetical protein